MSMTEIYRIKTRNSIYEIQVYSQDGTNNRPSRCRKEGSETWKRVSDFSGDYLEKLCIGPSFKVPGVVETSNVQDYAHFVLSTEPKRKARRGSETGIPEFFRGLADHVIEVAGGGAVVMQMEPEEGARVATPVYGQCTRCGCIEVELEEQKGVQDLSFMGEDPEYPFGSPCEVCKDKPLDWRSATAPDNWAPGETYAEALKV